MSKGRKGFKQHLMKPFTPKDLKRVDLYLSSVAKSSRTPQLDDQLKESAVEDLVLMKSQKMNISIHKGSRHKNPIQFKACRPLLRSGLENVVSIRNSFCFVTFGSLHLRF